MTGALAEFAWEDTSQTNQKLELSFKKIPLREKVDLHEELVLPRHWRSKSAPDEEAPLPSWHVSPKAFSKVKEDLQSLKVHIQEVETSKQNKHSAKKDHRVSLERDVKHLQTTLKGQRATKGILEQALARAQSVLIPLDCNFVSQHTRNLINDIAVLEVEVVQLEQYLLSLYRKAFESRVKDQTSALEDLNLHDICNIQDGRSHPMPPWKETIKHMHGNTHAKSAILGSKALKASIGNQSFNESKSNKNATANNPPRKGGVGSSYSQPLPFSRKEAKGSPSPVTCELWREVISADANPSCKSTEASIGEQLSETPNRLSEELVRCMAAIYCKLADPPIPYFGGPISPSPSSSSSSATTSSSKEVPSDGWSPHWRTDASPVNPHHRKTRIGSNLMVEVHWICVDDDRLAYAAKMLQNFRCLVQQLESVDPSQLHHEEKLAFWLNIYNALMMHAYLAYGIPRSHLKRASLLQKAAYKIGDYSINAHMIEHMFLGCRSHRPAQWIQLLLSPVSKKRGSHRPAYALEKPEPLVCFAVCCGGRSDPAVRVYTLKNIYHELDTAKRDFLQANVAIRKENKILVPRILEAFARDSSMGSLGLLEWICQNVTDQKKMEIRKCMSMKSQKCIEWIPYNFNFRYLFVRDLARWFPPISA